jgi:hypothetical protein
MREGRNEVIFTVASLTPHICPYQGYFFFHFAFQAFITSVLLPFYDILFTLLWLSHFLNQKLLFVSVYFTGLLFHTALLRSTFSHWFSCSAPSHSGSPLSRCSG